MTCCDCWLKMFGGIALTLFAICTFKFFYRIIYPYFIAKPNDLHALAGGDYAVVTGSTDGIGKQYAIQLAQKGFNIVLISRSEAKLAAVKKEITETVSAVKVETITFDFGNCNVKDYESKIFEKLNKLDVGILVNNVGRANDFPEQFHKADGGVEKSRDINVINTLSATILTQEILKQMVPRHAGIIINIGSIAGAGLLPEWSVYSATKKYISHLTAILAKEYSPLGITIQNIAPGLVTTNMSRVTETSFFAPNPKAFVEAALKTVGHVQETSGYYTHQIQRELLPLLPGWFMDFALKAENKKRREEYYKSIGSAAAQQ
uniref:Estradiol 17-beta-dehydrogenase 12 n=1 Tax=Rhabditophanes sp. KR3021 TaxID=114890 RepID=A0AC35UFC0_9BILA